MNGIHSRTRNVQNRRSPETNLARVFHETAAQTDLSIAKSNPSNQSLRKSAPEDCFRRCIPKRLTLQEPPLLHTIPIWKLAQIDLLLEWRHCRLVTESLVLGRETWRHVPCGPHDSRRVLPWIPTFEQAWRLHRKIYELLRGMPDSELQVKTWCKEYKMSSTTNTTANPHCDV